MLVYTRHYIFTPDLYPNFYLFEFYLTLLHYFFAIYTIKILIVYLHLGKQYIHSFSNITSEICLGRQGPPRHSPRLPAPSPGRSELRPLWSQTGRALPFANRGTCVRLSPVRASG